MKIICSIGPNVQCERDLDEFVDSGMNSMRLNFSHSDYSRAESQIKYMRKKHPEIEIIQDLQGNKLRVSNLFKGQIKVKTGESVTFCSEDFYKRNSSYKGESLNVPIAMNMNFKSLLRAERFLMKDATMEFRIVNAREDSIETKVVRGGIVRGEKGINAPGLDRSATKLTDKDKGDIIFGLNHEVDVICLSYASTKNNIVEFKSYIDTYIKKNHHLKMPKVWAKIECGSGVESFDKILDEVDGIMLGRGDLTSEVDIIEIPNIQHKFIEAMNDRKEELIIATFILDSMRNSTIPSLSEIDAIANFTKAKVDGIMLAGEVGVGRNPLDVIKTAKKIISRYK